MNRLEKWTLPNYSLGFHSQGLLWLFFMDGESQESKLWEKEDHQPHERQGQAAGSRSVGAGRTLRGI